MWDLVTGRDHGRLASRSGNIVALTVAEVNQKTAVVAATEDFTVRLWEMATGKPIGEPFVGHTSWVNAVTIIELEGREVVVSGGEDNCLMAWELATGAPIGQRISSRFGAIRSLVPGRIGDREVVVSGSARGAWAVWDIASGSMIGDPITEPSPIRAVILHTLKGRPVVVCTSDNLVEVWDFASRKRSYSAMPVGITNVQALAGAVVQGRQVVVSGSIDGLMSAWDIHTVEPLWSVDAHVGAIHSLMVKDLLLASGGADRSVRFWDLATGSPIGEPLVWHTDWVNALAMGNVDGELALVSASDDQTIRVSWLDLTASQPVISAWRQIDLGAQVLSVALSKTRLVAGTARGIVALEVKRPA